MCVNHVSNSPPPPNCEVSAWAALFLLHKSWNCPARWCQPPRFISTGAWCVRATTQDRPEPTRTRVSNQNPTLHSATQLQPRPRCATSILYLFSFFFWTCLISGVVKNMKSMSVYPGFVTKLYVFLFSVYIYFVFTIEVLYKWLLNSKISSPSWTKRHTIGQFNS